MIGQPVARLERVSRIFGHRKVFVNLSLELSKGKLVLLLGHNGAGKSTLLRILAGLCRPTSGTVQIMNSCSIAYLGHATFLYPDLTALENLNFWAHTAQKKVSRKNLLNLLERMNLLAYAKEPARIFSRGMAQRLNFCRVLLQEATLLLLDEPFSGLDESSRSQMREELSACRNNGCAIVLVSHDSQSDSQIADRVMTIKNHMVMDLAP